VFFAHFSVAVVTAVSCWPASVAAEVSLVSQSARGRVLCAKEFALLGLMVGVSAKKLSLRAQKGPQSAFYGVLGDFFATMPLEGLRWANFVSHKARYASCRAKNVSPTGAAIRLVAHAATSTPTARLECAVKLVARGYCTTWGAIALLCC